MGKKILIICDLCKNETDEDFTKLTFKKPGKSKGLNFEVCAACSKKFQVQLVGDDELHLAWNFTVPFPKDVVTQLPPLDGNQVFGSEADEDDHFIAEKEAERKRLLKEFKPKVSGNVSSDNCSHMNKTNHDPETFKQYCRDCGEEVEPAAPRQAKR
jgi:hypothetical protein